MVNKTLDSPPAILDVDAQIQVVKEIIALPESNSLIALHQNTHRIVKILGFEGFTYCVQITVDSQRPFEYVFDGYPKYWKEHKQDSSLTEIDPVFTHFIEERRILPMLWDPQILNKNALSIAKKSKTLGPVSGLSIPISTKNSEHAIFSLASNHPYKAIEKIIFHTLGNATLLGTYLHETIHRLVLQKEYQLLQNNPLTERERECLKWAMAGKTAWEIGRILTISERTSVFHLSNAAKKLNVGNRQQAIAKAIKLGLI